MPTSPWWPGQISLTLSLALTGCWASATRGGEGGTGAGGAGGAGAAGAAGQAGGGGTGTGGSGGARSLAASGLPNTAATGVPQPSGTPGNLTVLDWAGFKAAVSWTFDDSQPSQLAHYPELAAVGVPVTFYISIGNDTQSGYDATWTQAARDGHELGNHSVHHCHADLTGCSFGTALPDLASEIDQCSSYIPQHYPQANTWTAASPFGDTGYDSLDQSRFLVNRGVGDGMIGAKDGTDPFNLPIHLAATGETAASFDGFTDTARANGKWVIFLIHSITPTAATWYNPVEITDVTAAMGYGKSLPDVWSDSVVAVAAYWRAQKLLAAVVPTTAGSDTTFTWTLPAHFPPGKFVRVTVDGGTLTQAGAPLAWNDHGYYEVALDAGSLTLSP